MRKIDFYKLIFDLHCNLYLDGTVMLSCGKSIFSKRSQFTLHDILLVEKSYKLVTRIQTFNVTVSGFSLEELMNVPAGRRRKYHDDVTVIVIILGTNKRASKASTCV